MKFLSRSLLMGLMLTLILPIKNAIAQESANTPVVPPEIEQPTLLGINKVAAHATLMPYGNLKEALKADRSASAWNQSLNGNWKFNWVKRPEERPADFYKPDYDVSDWKEIPVPSNWEIQGYGTPFYRNFGYTFKPDFPFVMHEPSEKYTAFKERNPVGSYRRDFVLPKNWSGKEVWLTFDGVDAGFFLWINGQKVGYSVNSRNAAEFNVTPYVKPGNNIVAVEVYKYTAGSYLEDQDMWRLSGIFRNVTLWASPKVHIRDYFIKTDLDDQYQNATLQLEAKVHNYGAEASPVQQLAVTVYKDGRPILPKTVEVPRIPAGGETTVSLQMEVEKPLKWTAETPYLYTTVLDLKEGKKSVELLSSRIGFRKIEIKGRQFLVNGVPIKLKGVNRHENWPEVGHAVTEEQMIKDLEVIKQGNCNHVRTCHYSDAPRWYELCDEYGIYVVAEANVECHGLMNRFNDEPQMKEAIIDRNVANVESFKNHPSVIIWSLGNECGNGGGNFRTALQTIRDIDPTRPTHYEGFGIGKDNPADLDSRMYTHPNELESRATDSTLTKPFYLCEYAHAMFNSMGSIGDYNDLFDKYPSLLGGAVWEFQDQGIWNRRDPNHQILAFGGGFGEFPNDHYFIHKGVVASDRSAKPHYPEMKHAYQWITIKKAADKAGKVLVRNRYQFINLDRFRAYWSVSEDGKEIRKGTLGVVSVAPGEEKQLDIPYDTTSFDQGHEYFLRVWFVLEQEERWAAKGYEVAAQQLAINKPDERVSTSHGSQPLQLKTDTGAFEISGKSFAFVFDRAKGTFTSITNKGTQVLAEGNGPLLHLWRAPHQKDDMWANEDWEKYGIKDLTWIVQASKAEQLQPGEVQISVSLQATGKEDFQVSHQVIYTVKGDGTMHVENKVNSDKADLVIARMGVRWFMNPAYKGLRYYGRGPWENYSDRKRAAEVGLYDGEVATQLTPYEKPMEGGNHEDVRWFQLNGDKGSAIKILADTDHMQFSAVPYTDEQMESTEYRIDLPKSETTVLCISHQTLGVGSNGCGPRPLDAYLVYAKPCTFSYDINLL